MACRTLTGKWLCRTVSDEQKPKNTKHGKDPIVTMTPGMITLSHFASGPATPSSPGTMTA